MMCVEDELYQSYLSPKVQANFYSASFFSYFVIKNFLLLPFRKAIVSYLHLSVRFSSGIALNTPKFDCFLSFFSL